MLVLFGHLACSRARRACRLRCMLCGVSTPGQTGNAVRRTSRSVYVRGESSEWRRTGQLVPLRIARLAQSHSGRERRTRDGEATEVTGWLVRAGLERCTALSKIVSKIDQRKVLCIRGRSSAMVRKQRRRTCSVISVAAAAA
ncbi:hypothetical protein L226DRAFT_320218 [Lentinus tigrinus ALCF2SS1-7]|uniref:uncharacterized protein n=1 Tax=Lentinus tigrinus ALCF2SS1-7 TaxID=1328758 RepID=UPI001165F4C2|nr:hypothetical protein L226DRAFT_320218 [Lentinus tigrinus ALCF2SS1-7]